MLIKKENAREKANSKECTVWEYDFPSKNLGFATAKINGRYPEKGKAMNTICDEMYYVISGEAVVHTADGEFKIKQGDAFLFEKNKWYWVEAKNLFIALPTAPAWYFEQYKQLE
jgi:mannose-6-phosphate isomerase-like protein (cupin superfamily)